MSISPVGQAQGRGKGGFAEASQPCLWDAAPGRGITSPGLSSRKRGGALSWVPVFPLGSHDTVMTLFF